jgi:hypothetical protein
MSASGEALRLALTQLAPTPAIHELHEQAIMLQQRK